MAHQSYDAIIFDLGGVILPLDPGASVAALSDLFSCDASQLYTQVKQIELFDQLERGEVTSEEFRSALSEICRATTSVSPDSIDEAFSAMLGRIPGPHLDFLADLKKRKRTFVLSNTNVIHVTRFLADFAREHGQTRPGFAEHFEAVHYSHDLGMRKPEARIFRELIKMHGLIPERTIFVDDNKDNIASAQKLGLIARLHPTNAPLTRSLADV